MTEITLVLAEDVKPRTGGKTKSEKYGKYARAVAGLIPWLEENINKSPDQRVIIKISDMTKELGPEYEKKSDSAIYWALKFVLFHNGIFVDTATHKGGGKLLVMRKATTEDRLPGSLTKNIDTPEVPEEDNTDTTT